MHSGMPKHGADGTQHLPLSAAWYKRLWWRYTQTAQRASPPPRYLLVVLLAAQILFLAVVRLGPDASFWGAGSTPPLQPSSTHRFMITNAVQALPQHSPPSLPLASTAVAVAINTSKITSSEVAANAEAPLVKATARRTTAPQRTEEKKSNHRKGKSNSRIKERSQPAEPLFNGSRRKGKPEKKRPKPPTNGVQQSRKASTISSAPSDDLLPSVDVQLRTETIIPSVSGLESRSWTDVEEAEFSDPKAEEDSKRPLQEPGTVEKGAMEMEMEGYKQTVQPSKESSPRENKTEEMDKAEVLIAASPVEYAAPASDSHAEYAAPAADSHADDSSAATTFEATATATPAPSRSNVSSSVEHLVAVKETAAAIVLATAAPHVHPDVGAQVQGEGSGQQASGAVGDEELIRRSGDEGGLVSSSCENGYIYVYDLPPQFNRDITANCSALNPWEDMCRSLRNGGLGETLSEASTPLGQVGSWYATDQFTAELVFHNRMLQHPCLTDRAEAASGIYVPFYAGLDVGRYLWGEGNSAERRDRVSREVVEWVRGQEAWKRRGGADHFMMVGRITWDFRRSKDEDWGSGFFYNPGMRNVTRLLIERNPWDPAEMGVPYPTDFHPQSLGDLRAWQAHLRARIAARTTTVALAAAPRRSFPRDFRAILLAQCLAAGPSACRALDCSAHHPCHNTTLSLFMDSVFCLQPRGDSFTRRSTFDCLLAGSIPVFFWRRSAYLQYNHHLPADHSTYSVFISKEDVRNGTQILEVLQSIPPPKLRAMQEAVIQLIPRIVYAASGFSLKDEKDAFDVAVDAVLKSFRHQASASE